MSLSLLIMASTPSFHRCAAYNKPFETCAVTDLEVAAVSNGHRMVLKQYYIRGTDNKCFDAAISR